MRVDPSETSEGDTPTSDDRPGRFGFVGAIAEGRRFETRVGIATLLSFLVLVTALVVSSRRKRQETSAKPPADGTVLKASKESVPPIEPVTKAEAPPKKKPARPAEPKAFETTSPEPETPPRTPEIHSPITAPTEPAIEPPASSEPIVAPSRGSTGTLLIAAPPSPATSPPSTDPTPAPPQKLAPPPEPEAPLPEPPPTPTGSAPIEATPDGSGSGEKSAAPSPGPTAAPEVAQPPLPEPQATPPREIPRPAVDSGEWVALPNLGKHFRPADGPVAHPESADISKAREEKVGDANPIQPIEHVVARGEDFAAISKQYYASDRYAKALWAANKGKVATMDDLLAGTTVRIPPLEALNPSLIESARAASPGPAPGARVDPDASRVADRPSDGFTILPVGRPSMIREAAQRAQTEADDESDRRSTPRFPTYVASKIDTFRSIARKTLGDADRADEIRRLNLDVVDDPNRPRPGQKLKLPMDAKIPR